jgi:hypothetical protein
MSGPTEDTASSASEKPERRHEVFALGTARRMLPLVRHVVHDLVQARQVLARLQPEKATLDRQRRNLAWPERSRRYQLDEEIAVYEERLQDALAELEGVLGVVLLDADSGRVGFPTKINERQAFFSWQPSEEGLQYWHFAGDGTRRQIPTSWSAAVDVRPVRQLP